MKKDTDNAKTSPLLGFTPNFDSVKSEVAQLQAITDETTKVLTCGIEPNAASYFADIKNKANKAGLDKVLQTIEKQANDWKSQNGK